MALLAHPVCRGSNHLVANDNLWSVSVGDRFDGRGVRPRRRMRLRVELTSSQETPSAEASRSTYERVPFDLADGSSTSRRMASRGWDPTRILEACSFLRYWQRHGLKIRTVWVRVPLGALYKRAVQIACL